MDEEYRESYKSAIEKYKGTKENITRNISS